MAECMVIRKIRDGENTVKNTATKPNDQMPESNTSKEAAVIDQQIRQKKNNRNRRNKNNNTQVLNAEVSGTKDDHGIFIKASVMEPGDIFQDSILELEEITQHTSDIEVQEIEDVFNCPTQTPETLRPIGNARTLVVEVNTGNIWGFWTKGIVVNLVDLSHQQITIKTSDLLISLVHARSPYVQRRALWEELSQLSLNVEAWAVAGDFNVVILTIERKGGRLPCQTTVNESVDFINGNALMDTTSLGFKFSWSNKRHRDSRMGFEKKKKKKNVTDELEWIMKEQEENPFNVQLQEMELNKEEELIGILDTEAA
ncbi:hypothetical protein IFM89_012603 [Coptis chinensis]|uniref:Endonuclease/exonuclease/phosphatase domain-containing protein n=1 Tax=Coptis chinensis TaxID=261450 RepID=A0A835ME45_9MAGN|nr:hypothetical protein IFM89_012603 [Coptis chinensis]